ncbi:unnamed protein product [Closterium sp. NIES-64]|nr:unnamed protein product [Closterium sp. NIES-64]
MLLLAVVIVASPMRQPPVALAARPLDTPQGESPLLPVAAPPSSHIPLTPLSHPSRSRLQVLSPELRPSHCACTRLRSPFHPGSAPAPGADPSSSGNSSSTNSSSSSSASSGGSAPFNMSADSIKHGYDFSCLFKDVLSTDCRNKPASPWAVMTAMIIFTIIGLIIGVPLCILYRNSQAAKRKLFACCCPQRLEELAEEEEAKRKAKIAQPRPWELQQPEMKFSLKGSGRGEEDEDGEDSDWVRSEDEEDVECGRGREAKPPVPRTKSSQAGAAGGVPRAVSAGSSASGGGFSSGVRRVAAAGPAGRGRGGGGMGRGRGGGVGRGGRGGRGGGRGGGVSAGDVSAGGSGAVSLCGGCSAREGGLRGGQGVPRAVSAEAAIHTGDSQRILPGAVGVGGGGVGGFGAGGAGRADGLTRAGPRSTVSFMTGGGGRGERDYCDVRQHEDEDEEDMAGGAEYEYDDIDMDSPGGHGGAYTSYSHGRSGSAAAIRQPPRHMPAPTRDYDDKDSDPDDVEEYTPVRGPRQQGMSGRHEYDSGPGSGRGLGSGRRVGSGREAGRDDGEEEARRPLHAARGDERYDSTSQRTYMMIELRCV